ncbi:hypothetical protein H5J25_14340 [Sphingomonas aliaeris]|uniref:Uncharacterized protein n=1 Tax=Sphingomonas aliaeris TaxID=2759526 RepID=A0A974NTA7_9SPHN|nr:hypothetical protein [Sphingomonas aliaeris]QQV76609.1 hypothetical protein H5J25_14340 [Sphingomonas aliaeris]
MQNTPYKDHRISNLAQRLHDKLDAEVIDRLSRLEAKIDRLASAPVKR